MNDKELALEKFKQAGILDKDNRTIKEALQRAEKGETLYFVLESAPAQTAAGAAGNAAPDGKKKHVLAQDDE